MPYTLPATLPAIYKLNAGVAATVDLDTGGYDFMVGGHGFRLATDQQFPYQRVTEPTTTRRFDDSAEPGEQSLSPLPWIKSQSSFHGGAGQLNLEQGRVSFQYQQEQVDRLRFDTSLGVDVWTPGQVKRLPDCTTTILSPATQPKAMVTAAVNGTEYAIIGGVNCLIQVAWPSGPDFPPTYTQIDLSGTAFGGTGNCTVTSLCTDGTNYYGVLQMTNPGYVTGVLTYIISGRCDSTAAPKALYEVPNTVTGNARTNLATNPSFETGTAGWAVGGSVPPTLSTSTTQAYVGAQSLLVTWGAGGSLPLAQTTLATTSGTTYTVSMYVYIPAGSPGVTFNISGGGNLSGSTSVTGSWQRISQTWKATGSSSAIQLWPASSPSAGQQVYVDAVLIEVGAGVGTYFDGSTAGTSAYNYSWAGTANASQSVATPVAVTRQSTGCVGWQKARLVGCLGRSLYELDPNTAEHSSLPSARYTHPIADWTFIDTADSPGGILAGGSSGSLSEILEFTLDTSGGTPFLAGGASVGKLPSGESLYSLQDVVGTYLAISTSKGVRIGTFNDAGTLSMGPVTLTLGSASTTAGFAARDRFVYAPYTNQQADGSTGLARIDLSMIVDTAGRYAWAPDLRPPSSAPSRTGFVYGVAALPSSGRIVYITAGYIHVEGNGPGTDDVAWLRTSRIRYDTAEMKLFKLGRIHGTLDVANIQVTGIAPYGVSTNLGTFGFYTASDPGEFRLPTGLNEWIQLQFSLQGSACVFNSYQVKAYPAPKRQHIITLTANCFRNETDRFGLDVTDPEDPRQRYLNLKDLESAGNEVRFVEFTNSGSIAEMVVIDQLGFQSYSRPNIEDDFGGYITLKLRSTES